MSTRTKNEGVAGDEVRLWHSMLRTEPQLPAVMLIKRFTLQLALCVCDRLRNQAVPYVTLAPCLTSSRYLSVCTVSCLRPATGGGVRSLHRAFLVCWPCALRLAIARRRASSCLAICDSPSVCNHITVLLTGTPPVAGLQGPGLVARVMFGFGPGSNDGNRTLRTTFRPFSGHYLFAKEKVCLVVLTFVVALLN
jgi:hypothetical protein